MSAVVLIGLAVMIFGGGALTWWLLAPQPNTENPDIRNILNKKRNQK